METCRCKFSFINRVVGCCMCMYLCVLLLFMCYVGKYIYIRRYIFEKINIYIYFLNAL